MRFFRLILSFAPWLAFLALVHSGPGRLPIALLVGLALSVVMGLARLQRGVIFWTGLVFFSLASLAVVGFHDVWTARHMAILAPGALALATWIGLAAGRPFTLVYARAETDPSLWNSPEFLRINRILTTVWGMTFTVNALLAVLRLQRVPLPWFAQEPLTYGLMLAAAGFTSWYPVFVRGRRQRQHQPDAAVLERSGRDGRQEVKGDPLPIAADTIAPPARQTNYPPPFAARVAGRMKRKLGDHFGLSRFGVNLTELAPGAVSALAHHHSRQDEFVYVLEGTVTLVLGDREHRLGPGDCMGFRAGNGIAHQLVNRSGAPVRYLEIGDRSEGDTVEYPHDDLRATLRADGAWALTHKDGRPWSG